MTKKHAGADKHAVLREAGALNPRPETVADEIFQLGSFFDARDIVQVKYEMLRRVHKDGLTVTRAAEAFGFSRPVFYQARALFAKGGLPGLLPQRRGPHGPHKLGGAVLDFLEEAMRNGHASRASDLARLVKERFGFSVHPRSIERVLKRREKKRRGKKKGVNQ